MMGVPEFDLTAEQIELRDEIRAFVAEEIEPLDFNDWEWRDDPNERVPWHVIEAGAERGLMDLTVPEEFDGRDADPVTLTVAVEELAAGEMGISVIFDQCWKIARIINELADEPIRSEFFEEFTADPRHLLAITFTEPANGSNYVVPYENVHFDTVAEKNGDEWVISGEKRYISNGADAKTYVVFAQTDPEVPAPEGTTAFLVPRDAEGLEVTHVWEMITQRMNNNATVEFDEVRISEDRVLGEVHAGLRNTGEVLKESHIEAGATALGTARAAHEAAWEYAHERRQGGTEIVNHQSVGHDLAEMSMELQAARSLLWTAARAVERQGDEYQRAYGHMAKVFAAETAVDVTRRSLEIFGGYGVMFENERPMQKYMRDVLSFLHSDGTQRAHTQSVLDELREERE